MNKKKLATIILALLGAASLNAQMGNKIEEIYAKAAMMKKNIAQQSAELKKLKPKVSAKAQARIDKFSNWLQKLNQNITRFEEGLQAAIEKRSQWLARMTTNMEKFNERFIKFQENVKSHLIKKQPSQPVSEQPTNEQVAVSTTLPSGTVKKTFVHFAPGATDEEKKKAIKQAHQNILPGS